MLMVASPVVLWIPVLVIIMLGSWLECTEQLLGVLFEQFHEE